MMVISFYMHTTENKGRKETIVNNKLLSNYFSQAKLL